MSRPCSSCKCNQKPTQSQPWWDERNIACDRANGCKNWEIWPSEKSDASLVKQKYVKENQNIIYAKRSKVRSNLMQNAGMPWDGMGSMPWMPCLNRGGTRTEIAIGVKDTATRSWPLDSDLPWWALIVILSSHIPGIDPNRSRRILHLHRIATPTCWEAVVPE